MTAEPASEGGEAASASAAGPSWPPGVQPIAHTADLGFDVEAPSLELCFARTAAALFRSFVPRRQPDGAEPATVELDVHADRLDELMVAWLEELLYLSEVREIVLTGFVVRGVDAGRVTGQASGWKAGPGTQYSGPAIKGVTRHGLVVERKGAAWHARVFVDV